MENKIYTVAIIGTGARNLETSLAVIPESEQATIALASISIAIAQVACEIASTEFLILNSDA